MSVIARCAAAFLVSVTLITTAAAQGLTVTGHASVRLEADRVEIRGTLKVTADNAPALFASYTNARKKLHKALKGVDEPGVTITSSGPQITLGAEMNQAMIMMGAMEGAGQAETPKINAKENFTISIALGDRAQAARRALLATYLETAQEGGLDMAPASKDRDMMMMMMIMGQRQPDEGPGPVTWTFEDRGAVEDQVFRAAIADARERADRLARAAKVTITGIKGIKAIAGGRVSHLDHAEGVHDIDVEVTFSITDN